MSESITTSTSSDRPDAEGNPVEPAVKELAETAEASGLPGDAWQAAERGLTLAPEPAIALRLRATCLRLARAQADTSVPAT